ncbi:zinc finger C3H1 domain-containing protein isoform X1 [Bufo bufo]|uniref:zinc finger C3H1 domain-containing protein isoform X1 n=1 Tax=Bufo bufo TaxID=8384 RepID=UPI001ABDE9F9|nr:zinc finger C3H1 domain-containing protein isoform X1 [Bufo bufo]
MTELFRSASPGEEGELEDGEIRDDSVRPDSPKPFRHRSRGHPHQYHARPSRPNPHNYRPKEQYRLPSRIPPPSPLGDMGSRPSFWERSHDTLGRFRSRGRGGRFWDREWLDRGVKPGGPRQMNCGWRDPSPRKLKGRSPPRKPGHCVEESFEELLLKYKQIKLELESINKDEKLALKEGPVKEEVIVVEKTTEPPPSEEKSPVEEALPVVVVEEKPPVKIFQAFELKPLRQRLKPITEQKQNPLEETKSPVNEEERPVETAEFPKEVEKIEQTVPTENNTEDVIAGISFQKPVVEEEELSELHLRLLALQSASKKWQQKEQLVMKEGKEKLSKGKTEPLKESGKPEPQKEKSNANSVVTRRVSSAANAAKQARRRQQTKAWKKLQQVKSEEKRKEEEEKKKQAEEEERKKREEEIRKIRDLSNQEEQYNRFMKLVGDKSKRTKSFDAEQKRAEKQSLENSGGIYQYDNYEEVAMDTDSETNSPGASPSRSPYFPGNSIGCVPSVLCVTEQFPSQVWPSPCEGSIYDPVISKSSPEVPLPPPPLPPEEPEQPPKPPFADEEEEEEMLLREELLKSLANKRANKAEEQTSQPPSPPLTNIMPVPRITLTSANVNTATHRKTTTQIVRVLRPIRHVIKLPKHKSVVVTLNASDDSESDAELHSPGVGVFGGLESMIKEARRTAEASKPKAPSKSEKENDPMRTPEALPDDKKMEYRLLREEIANREKQKLLKIDQSKASLSPTNSDMEADGNRRLVKDLKVTEAESRHMKQRVLLLKDESLLKHLLQQEEKKRESIRTAELKITRLSEQLQATEKFLNANRALLKKLQEQIAKVEHRVEEKRTLSLKYGEELARAKALASQELGKRKLEPSNMGANKMLKVDTAVVSSPKKQSAEAIAQEKKRLQELEQEYALKIQKLKEMQARKMKEQPVYHPPVAEEPAEFALPQPSLHDLSQDKITLDSEENEPDDDDLSFSVKERRKSFRDSCSFTKPNLKHAELTPYKEVSNTPSKMATEGAELFFGMNIDEVRRLHSNSSNLTQLLAMGDQLLVSSDKLSPGKEIPVDVDLFAMQTKQTDVRPLPFGPYRSPLLVFKSYRFSPYFRTKEKLLLSSVSYSNMIEPKTFFCRFDLTGTCNDDDCQWQHMRDCTLSRKKLFQDILSYNLDLIGCSEISTDEEITAAAEKYVDKLFGVKRDHMSMDLMSVLLVSHVNESLHHTPPHTTYKEKRKWKPMYWKKPLASSSSDEDDSSKAINCARLPQTKTKVPIHDAVVTSEDIRYFTSDTDDISNLEASVNENPLDIQLWIKLTYKCLNQNEGTSSECLDSALNVLSRALEHNRDNPEIWSHYLKLFSQRGTREEIQEMCETAVEYAPSYQTWWTFLTLENSFDGKDQVCGRTLQYLVQQVEAGEKSELLSLQCLQVLLYRVHVNLFTGRLQNALAILQNALKSPCEKSIADHLFPKDRCLAWLSYIHLMEFNSLPANFFDPTVSNPSRIVTKEPFLIPWQNPQSIMTDPVMLLALFEAAVFSCSDDTLSAEERIEVCLPLYKNMILLHLRLDRHFAAVNLCKQLLESSSRNCDLLESLCSVYMKKGQLENALEVWITAFRSNPGNAQMFYNVCKFLIQQDHLECLSPLVEEFVMSFFENPNEKYTPADLFRYLLNFSVPLDFIAPALKNDGLPNISDMQRPYLWLVFCLWQSLHATREEAADAYEAALGVVMQQDMLQKLWMDYLVFTNSKIMECRNKVQDSKHFADLVNRCLMTVSTRQPTPFSTAEYWTNYDFHNSVIFFYLSCAPRTQHSKILERFSSMMPTNLGLALRILKQEMDDNNVQIVKMQSKMLTYNFRMCLTTWKIAIAVETFLKGHKEVQHLYQSALQKLPLCAELWKDQLLFEASGGGKTDNLRKLVSKCQEVGVSLDELLNLNTESKNR